MLNALVHQGGRRLRHGLQRGGGDGKGTRCCEEDDSRKDDTVKLGMNDVAGKRKGLSSNMEVIAIVLFVMQELQSEVVLSFSDSDIIEYDPRLVYRKTRTPSRGIVPNLGGRQL